MFELFVIDRCIVKLKTNIYCDYHCEWRRRERFMYIIFIQWRLTNILFICQLTYCNIFHLIFITCDVVLALFLSPLLKYIFFFNLKTKISELLKVLQTFSWWYTLRPWWYAARGDGGRRAGSTWERLDMTISSYFCFLICCKVYVD